MGSCRRRSSFVVSIFLVFYLHEAQSSTCSDNGLGAIPPGFSSNKQQREAVSLYYVRRDNATGPTVVLLHGWPQNWASWHEIMLRLPAHYDVIAVNLRGVIPSDSPAHGYRKKTMAADLHRLLVSLRITSVHLAGHDIGGMVSYAFARLFPELVRTMTIIDVPLPGSPQFDLISSDPRAWHFGFNAAEEFPEGLTYGREAFFYGTFMREIAGSPDALTPAEIQLSVNTYSIPSTARAGFNWYREFAADAKDNEMFAKQAKLKMPVLALNAGFLSPFPYVLQMMRLYAQNVRGEALDSGHWIPEEVPDKLAQLLIDFIGGST